MVVDKAIMFNNQKIKTAVIWSSIEAISTVLLSLISIIYLARILHPEDYGNVATAQIISSLIGLVFSFGLTEAIIQKKIINESIKETAFSISLIFAIGALVVSVIILLLLYDLVNNPLIVYIFAFEIVGITTTILALVPTGLLLRELKTSALTKRTLISKFLFFVVAIPLAISGYGVWSIVFANLAQNISSMLLIFLATREYLPKKLSINKIVFKELFLFGFYVMIENIIWSVLSRVFSLLIASFHGTYALGLYNMASRITDSVLAVLSTIINRIALPLFSQVQDDLSKLHSIFYRATKIFNFISMPAFSGMAITAKLWVPLVLGDNWIPVIPILQVICIMNAIIYSRIFVGTAMKAVGQSKRFMILSIISATLSVITVFITKNYSLLDTVGAWAVVRVLITIPIGIYLMYKVLSMGYYNQIRSVLGSSFNTIIMAISLLLLNDSIIFYSDGKLLAFIVSMTIGISIYLISSFIISYLSIIFNKVIIKG